jgi:hypothetical protein
MEVVINSSGAGICFTGYLLETKWCNVDDASLLQIPAFPKLCQGLKGFSLMAKCLYVTHLHTATRPRQAHQHAATSPPLILPCGGYDDWHDRSSFHRTPSLSHTHSLTLSLSFCFSVSVSISVSASLSHSLSRALSLNRRAPTTQTRHTREST